MMLGETRAIRIPAWTSASDVYSGRNFSCGNAYGEGGELYSYFYSDGGGLSSAVVFPASYDRCLSDDGGEEIEAMDSPVDAYSCDEFRMYEFKVRKCARGRSHDWTECPYAHPGEKARRRDPRKFHYSGTPCPDFRKGSCRRGDFCEFAHGVFECWLHPARYRTQPCKDGMNCRRRVCFFAHTPDQLRILPPSASDESPLRRHTLDAYITISPPSDSPPLSSMNEMAASMQQMQLSNAMSVPVSCGSPHGLNTSRPSFYSLPATPTSTKNRIGRILDGWEEPTERVESGRSLRAKLYEKLSKENFSEKTAADEHEEAAAVAGPDVDWITELLK